MLKVNYNDSAMKPPFQFKPNKVEHLDNLPLHGPITWVRKNTAILIVHGIGNQLPLETLDDFGRGLIREYKKAFGDKLHLQHIVMPKAANGKKDAWFDNVIRLTKEGDANHIDLYEYYWANCTEDKATWHDLNTWLQGVVSGAKRFYRKNGELGEAYKDNSIFFTKEGKFRHHRYRFFIYTVSKTFILINLIVMGLLKIISYIPVIGEVAETLIKMFLHTVIHKLTSIIGDVAVYNVVDPKSRFYCVHREVKDGAVDALKFLIELEESVRGERDMRQLAYPSVVVAGHSLGSQIAYDAINKMNLFANKGLIKNYTSNAHYIRENRIDQGISKLTDQMHSFITFGSPLDKIVFFLREDVDRKNYLRQQLLCAYHGFKQRDWNLPVQKKIEESGQPDTFEYLPLNLSLKRLLDDIRWRNYYDDADYVSGGLDFYDHVENINCDFKKNGLKGFSHSFYWIHDKFYRDIIINILNAHPAEDVSHQHESAPVATDAVMDY